LYTYDPDLLRLTIKIFLATSTRIVNIYGPFRNNLSTKYRDIASHEIVANGRTTEKHIVDGGGIKRNISN